jgi:hypothetical protein
MRSGAGIALLLLLAATLFHALRLERALGVLKRDRAVLEELVQGFNDSTRQAETGIERLRGAADGAGRQMSRQIEVAQLLRDDLNFLTDRSDRLAERLEGAIRSARMLADTSACQGPGLGQASLSGSQQPNAPPPEPTIRQPPKPQLNQPVTVLEDEAEHLPRLRSQAERDLLRALRAGH